MTEAAVRKSLEQFVGCFPTRAAAARKLGISRSYLTHILKGRKRVSPRVLDALGWEPAYRRVYRRIAG